MGDYSTIIKFHYNDELYDVVNCLFNKDDERNKIKIGWINYHLLNLVNIKTLSLY